MFGLYHRRSHTAEAQLHLQKGADNYDQAGLAQGDISAYYDSLNALRIARWIEAHSRNEGIFWSSAFLRLQLLPKVRLTAGGSCSLMLDCRTLGTLTGARSSVAAGRIPVETTACKLAESWRPFGAVTDAAIVTFASWVDNYYAFGASVSHAVAIAESFEDVLLQDWNLEIKPSSRSVIGPDPEADEEICTEKWPMHEEVEVLGHLVAANCSAWPVVRVRG